jgi:hypothetical protein
MIGIVFHGCRKMQLAPTQPLLFTFSLHYMHIYSVFLFHHRDLHVSSQQKLSLVCNIVLKQADQRWD